MYMYLGGGGLYMDEYLCFENDIFFSSNYTYNNVLTTVNTTNIAIKILQKNTGYQIQSPVFGISLFPLSSMLCLNLIIPNITPGGLFFWGGGGGYIHQRSFGFQ